MVAFTIFFRILKQPFYARELLNDKKAIVDEAQIKNIISYSQTGNPFKVILAVVKLVALDQPSEKVTPLVTSFNCVTFSC